MAEPIDPQRAAENCRCQDAGGERGRLYLSPFCAYRDEHKPLAEYGYPVLSIRYVATLQYHDEWLAGKYNEHLPPESWPGYRPPKRTEG